MNQFIIFILQQDNINRKIKTNERETYRNQTISKLNELHDNVKRKVKNFNLFQQYFDGWNSYLKQDWSVNDYRIFKNKFDDLKNNISRMSNDQEILSYLYNYLCLL